MTTYETVVVIGMALWILIALGLLISVGVVIMLLRRARRPLDRAYEVAEDLGDRLKPVIRQVERATEDVNYLIAALRTDVGAVGRMARNVSDSTERMVALVEQRVAEINGLLEVVQEEAEETFFSTASALRGIRGGREVTRGRDTAAARGGGFGAASAPPPGAASAPDPATGPVPPQGPEPDLEDSAEGPEAPGPA